MKWDVLIIGQGIAGTLLSFLLMEQGKKVLILDEMNVNSCSRIATALLNPVTGKRLRIDDAYSFAKGPAEQIYQRLSVWLNTPILSYHPTIRLFADIEQQNDWMVKMQDDLYSSFFQSKKPEWDIHPSILAPHGACHQNPISRVLSHTLLFQFRQKGLQEGFIQEKKIDFSALQIDSSGVQYEEHSALKIVFCTGWTREQIPYFPDLTFQPALGQLLYIEATEIPEDTIIMGPAVITPTGQPHQFAVGSIYDWKTTTAHPTPENRDILIKQLQKTICCPYAITGEAAAVRPTTPSRLPILLRHAGGLPAFCFNGLGTKGYSWGPAYAEQCTKEWIDA